MSIRDRVILEDALERITKLEAKVKQLEAKKKPAAKPKQETEANG